ncbi:IclR family transcriptional regulator [Shimia sp. R10_1]|uniref:IclR family transcriptional regulator n=1 Tax=Shimia sp. R10_1 TaxID=2821095 RepID=UPI001ADC41DC|nr:IclR family transcriptional regulator [Shimia sp. R10_1]MBO9475688.1 IclR family transcriptional regulator [Shimia sp. R10_1]
MSESKPTKAGGSDRINSVVTAVRILEVMAAAERPLALGEIAKRAEIGTSSAHRYIQSLLATRMVTQDGPNQPYDLGQNALQIGLSAARRFDLMDAASHEMKALCGELAVSGGIAVWTDQGPTLVRWYRSETFSIASLKLGDVLPLDNTACGLLFQAFMSKKQIETARQAQPKAFRGEPPAPQTLEQIRQDKAVSITGHLKAGVTGQAAAVFDSQDEISCVMTIVAGIGFTENPEDMKMLCEAAKRLNHDRTA